MSDEINEQQQQAFETKQSKPIGGWLYIIGFGVWIGPLITLASIIGTQLKGINNGSWTRLILNSSPDYHPIYLPTLVMEFLALIFIFFIQLISLYLYQKKEKRFPEVYSYLLIFSTALSILLYFAVSIYPTPDKGTLGVLSKASVQSLMMCLIWVTYMLKSVRVKETFIVTPTSLKFVSKDSFFLIPLLVLFLFFGWSYSNKSKNKNSTAKVQTKDVILKEIVDKTKLTPKQIAAMSLKNLVAIEPKNKDGKIYGLGSGFFILPHVIVTNAHVVEGAYEIQIRLSNSNLQIEQIKEVIAFDRKADLALLRTKELRSETPLELNHSNDLTIGSSIFTAGNPQGLEGTFTDGLISNRQRLRGIEMLQISAPISQGSSGGPVLNEDGKVIGVSTAIFKKGQNLNLVTPSVYIARLFMKTESFYPLAANLEIKSNGSISSLFPEVCDHLVDVDLPEKYFLELTDKDMKESKIVEACNTALPTCKKAWINPLGRGLVLIGSQKLEYRSVSKLSQTDLDKLYDALGRQFKNGYRKTDPHSQFQTSQNEINQNILRYNVRAAYSQNGVKYTDFRSFYFLLPYCRLDVILSSREDKMDFNGKLFEVISGNFVKALPSANTQRALYEIKVNTLKAENE